MTPSLSHPHIKCYLGLKLRDYWLTNHFESSVLFPSRCNVTLKWVSSWHSQTFRHSHQPADEARHLWRVNNSEKDIITCFTLSEVAPFFSPRGAVFSFCVYMKKRQIISWVQIKFQFYLSRTRPHMQWNASSNRPTCKHEGKKKSAGIYMNKEEKINTKNIKS